MTFMAVVQVCMCVCVCVCTCVCACTCVCVHRYYVIDQYMSGPVEKLYQGAGFSKSTFSLLFTRCI